MIIAQADLGQLPAGFLKQTLLLIVGIMVVLAFVLAAVFAGLQYFADRRRERREELRAANPPAQEISPLPVPVQKVFPSATVKELNDKYDEQGRRITKVEDEQQRLWTHIGKTEDKNAERFEAISRALGRIEGKLEGDPGN